jgi:hypothetical protein
MRDFMRTDGTKTLVPSRFGNLSQALGGFPASEKGVTLIMFMVVLFGLLGVIGLALDSGNVYLLKRRIATASDAGANALSEQLRLGREFTSPAVQNTVTSYTKSVFKMSGGRETIYVKYAQDSEGEPQVIVNGDADLWILDWLLGASGSAFSKAKSATEVVSRRVAIVIGTDPTANGDYPVSWPGSPVPSVDVPSYPLLKESRGDMVRDGLLQVVKDPLDSNIDFLSINSSELVPLSEWTEEVAEYWAPLDETKIEEGGFVLSEIEDYIDQNHGTNGLSDPAKSNYKKRFWDPGGTIERATDKMLDLGEDGPTRKAIVLIGFGAPGGGLFRIRSESVLGLRENNILSFKESRNYIKTCKVNSGRKKGSSECRDEWKSKFRNTERAYFMLPGLDASSPDVKVAADTFIHTDLYPITEPDYLTYVSGTCPNVVTKIVSGFYALEDPEELLTDISNLPAISPTRWKYRKYSDKLPLSGYNMNCGSGYGAGSLVFAPVSRIGSYATSTTNPKAWESEGYCMSRPLCEKRHPDCSRHDDRFRLSTFVPSGTGGIVLDASDSFDDQDIADVLFEQGYDADYKVGWEKIEPCFNTAKDYSSEDEDEDKGVSGALSIQGRKGVFTRKFTHRELRQLSYLYAIDEADYARENGIAVYTIGVGDESPEGMTKEEAKDPYQQLTDGSRYWQVSDSYVKDRFMRRVANACEAKEEYFNDTEVGGCDDTTIRGKYYNVKTKEELYDRLSEIVKEVQKDIAVLY